MPTPFSLQTPAFENDFKAYLSAFQLFTEAEANRLYAVLRPAHCPRRAVLLVPGERCEQQFFIVRGLTRTFELDERGREHTVAFGCENTWTGDLASYTTDTAATLTIECLEPTDLLLFRRADYEALAPELPMLDVLFRLLFQRAYVGAIQRARLLLSCSALERYQAFVAAFPALLLRLEQQHVASYLGVTPETLSRLLRTTVC